MRMVKRVGEERLGWIGEFLFSRTGHRDVRSCSSFRLAGVRCIHMYVTSEGYLQVD